MGLIFGSSFLFFVIIPMLRRGPARQELGRRGAALGRSGRVWGGDSGRAGAARAAGWAAAVSAASRGGVGSCGGGRGFGGLVMVRFSEEDHRLVTEAVRARRASLGRRDRPIVADSRTPITTSLCTGQVRAMLLVPAALAAVPQACVDHVATMGPRLECRADPGGRYALPRRAARDRLLIVRLALAMRGAWR